MLFSVITLFILICLEFNSNVSMAEEPMCSKFSCEEQLLEKMIRQEIKVEQKQNDIKKTQESVSESLAEMAKTQEDVSKALAETTKTQKIVSKSLREIKNNFAEMVERNAQDKKTNEEALKHTFDELRHNVIQETKRQIKNLTEVLDNMSKPSVAFFAHNVVDLKLDRTDKTIVFTTATTNEGSGYDISTGIFTAPVGGLYQFIVSYCSYMKQHATLALVISGNVIARSHNYDNESSTCSSFPVVARVEFGEKIWVKCIAGASGYVLYESTWMMNSFSGFLINK